MAATIAPARPGAPGGSAASRWLPGLASDDRWLFGGLFGVWVVTRLLVLAHQLPWLWMNQFVVDYARGFLKGNWFGAVRPPLASLLAMPLLATGATAHLTVACLYLLASLLQFAAFLLVARQVFPERRWLQALLLALLIVTPFAHSDHDFRDVPVVFSSAAVFFLAGHWLWASREPGRALRVWPAIGVLAAMVLGIWNRTETLTFVGAVILLGLALQRVRAWRLVLLYAAAAVLAVLALRAFDGVVHADLAQANRDQVHTFFDSTPASWLSPACAANPTENCRDADGARIFAPVNRDAGVIGLVLAHPWLALLKTARSAWDNLWALYGPNASSYPGFVPFVALLLLLFQPCRQALRDLPRAAWPPVLAAFLMTVLPPLSWAPPHLQYHLDSLLPVVVIGAAVIGALWRVPRGQWIAAGLLLWDVGLSAFRYTRYPGY